MSNQIAFKHKQHAHCESGVTANLLQYHNLAISEPMAFGVGAGMFFAHLPFVKVGGTPATTFRTWPGAIFKRASQRLGVKMHTQRFSTVEKAMTALDETLAKGIPVGILCSVYFLPYLPEAFRFHFNAHNIVIYGKDGDEYLVSDPSIEESARISYADLAKARFAKGTPQPKGMMYYVEQIGDSIDYKTAIQKGIKQTCWFMLSPPIPWFGNKAVGLLAKKIRKYPEKLSDRKATLYLGNIIRMQEEIGTGGGGFRYLYAAFLQEASAKLNMPELQVFSDRLTAIGDDWRHFAYSAARVMKARKSDLLPYDELGNLLDAIGKKEKAFFQALQKLEW